MDELIGLVRQAAGSNPAVSDDQIRTQLNRAKIRSIDDLNDELLGSIIDRLGGQNVLPGGGQEVESVESGAVTPAVSRRPLIKVGQGARDAVEAAVGVQDAAIARVLGMAQARAQQQIGQTEDAIATEIGAEMAQSQLNALYGVRDFLLKEFSSDRLLDGVVEAELID